MNIVPLAEYVRVRRGAEKHKAACSWARAAAAGRIPGAFRYHSVGPWMVDLDIHDAEVRKLTAPKITAAPDSGSPSHDIEQLAALLGLSDADVQAAKRAVQA